MKTLFILGIILSSFISTLIQAQSPALSHFEVRNSGLPQNQVLRAYIAPDGALWVATYGGVARFNGRKFDVFNVQNGLTSNTAYDIYDDVDTTWILTRDGLDILVNGNVKNYYYSDSIKFYHGRIYKSKDFLFIYGIYDPYLYDVKRGQKVTDFYISDSAFKAFPIHHSTGGFVFNDSAYFIHEAGLLKIALSDYHSEIYISNDYLRSNCGFENGRIARITGINNLILWNWEEVRYPENSNILHHVCQKSLTDDHSLLLKNIGHLFADSNLPVNFFSGIRGKVTFQDLDFNIYEHDGDELRFLFNPGNIPQFNLPLPQNYWITSDNGLWKVAMAGFEYYRPEDGFPKGVWGVFKREDTLVFSTNSNGIYLYHKNKTLSCSGINSFFFSAGGTFASANNLYLPFNQGIYKLEKGITEKRIDFPDVAMTTAYDALNNIVLGGCLSHLIAVDTNDQVHELLHTPDLGINNSILTILPLEDRYLLGLSRGLAEYDLVHQKANLITHENVRINDLEKDQLGNIWAATDRGLMKIEENQLVPVFNHYINEALLTLAVTDNQKLFIAGNTTLYVLDLNAYINNEPHCVLAYHQSAGYDAIGPLYNSFFQDEQGKLWLPTSEWVVKIDPDKIHTPEQHPRATFIRAFATNKSKNDTLFFNRSQKSIKVPYSLNSLAFSLEAVDLDFPEALRYEYLLEGLSAQWLALKDESELAFDNIPYGSYTLKVRATRTESFENVPVETVYLSVLPPFWFQWWFMALMILLFLGLLAYLYLFLIKRERKRSQRNLEILNLRSQALGVQMDNHFMVNCTAKIAGLNQLGMHTEAMQYALLFVRFLQKNLKLLRQDWVLLSEELDMVNAYVQIEQHGGNAFKYEVKVGSEVEADQFWIPPFIIQPLVENAIRHGIKNQKENMGCISIEIERACSDGVMVQIADNGIGIGNSQFIGGNGVSLSIINGRLKLIGNNSRIEIEPQETGTVAKLYICAQPNKKTK